MVGNLYPEGSRLKDRAYNIFYMGINVGAFLAPVVAEFMKSKFGFHPAFAVAVGGMALSIFVLAKFKRYIEQADHPVSKGAEATANVAATAVDAPPQGVSQQDAANADRRAVMDAVPDWKRVAALIVIFGIVVVFWMVFHQNGTTITYWGNENTNWKVTGIISNAINPGWVILLTFPVIALWRWLDKKGLEPSTPTKMVFGMVLTACAFLIWFLAAKLGEGSLPPGANPYALGAYKMSPLWLLSAYGVLTAGELMLSPMGLSLVSKVSPIRWRGIMMGGWFVATGFGNKLTQIGQLWDDWLHSTFWLFCAGCALFMALVLLVLLKPLKRAMPGV
jgi:proton-dependent oligopeptide transporter, POT family